MRCATVSFYRTRETTTISPEPRSSVRRVARARRDPRAICTLGLRLGRCAAGPSASRCQTVCKQTHPPPGSRSPRTWPGGRTGDPPESLGQVYAHCTGSGRETEPARDSSPRSPLPRLRAGPEAPLDTRPRRRRGLLAPQLTPRRRQRARHHLGKRALDPGRQRLLGQDCGLAQRVQLVVLLLGASVSVPQDNVPRRRRVVGRALSRRQLARQLRPARRGLVGEVCRRVEDEQAQVEVALQSGERRLVGPVRAAAYSQQEV